jgi:glutaredoxin-like YruB-family protein
VSKTTDDPTVTIYSTAWCGFCKMTMQYLDQKGVKYTDKNIEQDPAAYKELLEKIGGDYRGVPVIDVDGQLILGFDRTHIDIALEQAAK